MSIDLLDAPLRMSWQLLPPPDGVDASTALQLADRLVDAGVFFVTLEAPALSHPGCEAVLQRLAEGGCQTLAVCRGTAEELALLDRRPPLMGLLLEVTAGELGEGFPADRLSRQLDALQQLGCNPGLLLLPLRSRLAWLPELLRFARSRQVPRIKLPNIPLDDSLRLPSGEVPQAADWQALKARLAAEPELLDPSGTDCAVEVHDLFLWELLQPLSGGQRSEYGGCQAGNSLGHLDAAGRVHPCSSWPQPFGSLLEQSLEQLWQSPERLALRREIAAMPDGCVGCRDYPDCFGGCRGIAQWLRERHQGRDPGCAGPRGTESES